MAAVLLAAGQPGMRHAAPSCRVMLHEPSIALKGRRRSREVGIQHEQIERSRQLLRKMLAESTNQPMERMETLLEADTYMTAQEALELGLVDVVGCLVAPAPDEGE
mmetsp:Transcript_36222/g.112785  ORF Transcript_36222/g.112785 Transcript_36222/m.112785 type:complete len:106 (-) Transcript_36222:113-430(-)